MREREMEFCPFRTVMETFPAVLVGQGDVTRTRFELCLKEKCPAFRVMRGGRELFEAGEAVKAVFGSRGRRTGVCRRESKKSSEVCHGKI